MRKLVPILFLAVLLTGCTATQDNDFEAKATTLQTMVDSIGIPCMDLSLHDNGKTFSTVRIQSDIPEDQRQFTGTVRDDQMFQAASLSKVVFSYIVMKMVDSGEIDLDTPVCNYTDIDRFEDKEMASKLTPRMVLSHTSGLYNWADSPSSDSWPTSTITFHFPVDSCYGYSGEAFAFLQRAVEQIRGASLNDIATKEVFEPFDMPLSYYTWRPEYDSLVVCGFNVKGENRGRRETLRANCAYTLRTSSKEYMNFLVHAVMNGEGLTPETYKEWLTPRSHAIRYADEVRECDKDMYWCLGMGVKVSFDEAGNPVPQQYWHWGDNGSFKALYVVDINRSMAMDYFTNSAKGHWFCDDVCELFMGDSYGIQDWIDERDDD